MLNVYKMCGNRFLCSVAIAVALSNAGQDSLLRETISLNDKSKPKRIQMINMCADMGGIYNVITLVRMIIS